MLNQFSPAVISEQLKVELNSISLEGRSKAWDAGSFECVKTLKNGVMAHGKKEQKNRCAWCSLLIGKRFRRTIHRDHIAPKGKYPQWTFETINLVLACESCNGFQIKSTLDTVQTVNEIYKLSEFYIVHPYLNNPTEHISWKDTDKLLIHGVTTKGLWTIKHMQLDDAGLTVERTKDFLLQKEISTLDPELQKLYYEAIEIED